LHLLGDTRSRGPVIGKGREEGGEESRGEKSKERIKKRAER
jgi:hypothetical protein